MTALVGHEVKSAAAMLANALRRRMMEAMVASSLSQGRAYRRALADAESPLVSRLRWRALNALGETAVGRSLVGPLRARFPLALTLPYGEINDTIRLLDGAAELPRRQRPPASWRNANLWEYTRALMAFTTRIGLSGPRVWRSTSGEPRPVCIDWVALMHAYLRHPGADDESRARWLNESVDTSVTADVKLPWGDAPVLGRGRPRSDDEASLSVFAACVGRALVDDASWTSIAIFANGALKRELTGGEVQINCRRVAKRIGVFKKL
jgi:hypothetical protein